MQGLILVICIHENDIWLSDSVSKCCMKRKKKITVQVGKVILFRLFLFGCTNVYSNIIQIFKYFYRQHVNYV